MAPRWTIDELHEAVRAAAAEMGEPLRIVDYRAWQHEHRDAPTDYSIARRFGGSWSRAIRAAGVGSYGWGDEDLVDAVRACTSEHGRTPSPLDYRAWRQSQEDPRPSDGTIEQRLGGWSRAMELLSEG